MTTHKVGIIMNGVTGRMGMNQHLIRSIVAIRNQGGVALKNGDRVMPDPILIGRNADKVQALAATNDDLANLLVSTDIATALLDSGLRVTRFTTAASRAASMPATSRSDQSDRVAVDVHAPRRAVTHLE